jgi:hypothetical protein
MHDFNIILKVTTGIHQGAAKCSIKLAQQNGLSRYGFFFM